MSSTATLRVFRHPGCERCARIGRMYTYLDWRRRLEFSTATPKSGALKQGEVVVEEIATGKMLTGFAAYAAIARAVPVCAPVRILFPLRAFRNLMDRQFAGS